jgi:hypothetical protein
MSRDAAVIFGDLIGKLDVLRVACDSCGREHGRDAAIVNWLDEIAADCPKRVTVNWNDRCRVKCPDLPRVL